MKKEQWEQQIRWGITAFLVIAASVFVATLFINFDKIRAFVGTLFSILAPIIYGAVIAYITSPIYNRVYHWVHDLLRGGNQGKYQKHLVSSGAARGIARAAGTLVALLTVVILAVGLVSMIIPQLYDSIANLVATLPQNLSETYRNVMKYLQDYPEVREEVQEYYNAAYSYIMDFLQDHLMPNMQSIVASLGIGIWSVVNGVKNVFIGLIVMIYLLNIKESMLGESRKLTFALLPEKWAKHVVEEFAYINKVFGGFIVWKIIDSLIIGCLCFFCLSLMNMPYALLVSVIVGVTNVIPFFGPFIGAVPSFVLILLSSPVQSVYFLIFILVLQQFDGNILGPRILGDSTGLSSFWVLFSILLFGGLFGFVGMIVAVPLWAVILNFVQRMTRHLLGKKGLPMEAEEYISGDERARLKD
ncbi:MAG TPA: AI-2E family transporter [Oribacterium sp.]|nr:AI-2E family transporter [Oribacterium sp.]